MSWGSLSHIWGASQAATSKRSSNNLRCRPAVWIHRYYLCLMLLNSVLDTFFRIFITDQLADLTCLTFVPSSGMYQPHNKDWVKEKIYVVCQVLHLFLELSFGLLFIHFDALMFIFFKMLRSQAQGGAGAAKWRFLFKIHTWLIVNYFYIFWYISIALCTYSWCSLVSTSLHTRKS